MIRPIAIDQMKELVSQTIEPLCKNNRKNIRKRVWRKLLWQESQGRCAYCGQHTPDEHRTIEHLIPTSKGGPNHLCNVIAACAPCNNGKPNDVSPSLYCKDLSMFFLVMLKETMAYKFVQQFGCQTVKRLDRIV